MSDYRIFVWDDQSFHWISAIGAELHRLRPSWGIRYESGDAANMGANLKKDSKWFFRESVKAAGDVSVVFNVYCTREVERLDFSPYLAAVVDDMFEGESTLTEKQREHYGTFEIAKRIQATNPHALTIVATAHVLDKHVDPAEMLAQAQGSILMFLDKQDLLAKESPAVRRCVAGLIVAAVAKQQATEAERKLSEENTRLRHGLRVRDEVAHGRFGLLDHVRHLVGMDEAILTIARTIEPFYQQKDGTYQTCPKVLQRKFPAALMLEGEPGSGKTTLCMAIAQSLGIVHHLSPALISPGPHVAEWQVPLQQTLTQAFDRAHDGETVVIKADDIAWPDVGGIQDHGLRAEWQDLMSFLRICIRLASALNNHAEPTEDPLDITNKTAFRGKVLWLFARNQDAMIGEMFAPLKDILLTVTIVFPKDEASRRRILELYAEKGDVAFADDAMALVLKTTADYSGRALIGDDDMGRGFIFWAVAAVKDRELARWKADNACRLEMVITRDVVEKWLSGPLHKGVVRLAQGGTSSFDPHKADVRERIVGSNLPILMAGLDRDRVTTLASEILRTRGDCIEHDPDRLMRDHGGSILRAVFALIYDALQRKCRNMPSRKVTRRVKGGTETPNRDEWLCQFNEVFGFGDSVVGVEGFTRPSESASLYCKKLPTDLFPPAPGMLKYGMARIKSDAQELREAGIQLEVK